MWSYAASQVSMLHAQGHVKDVHEARLAMRRANKIYQKMYLESKARV